MPNIGVLLPKNQMKGKLFYFENKINRPMVKIIEKVHFYR